MFSMAAVALCTVGVNSPDEGEKSDNKCKKRKEKDKTWRHGAGSKLGAHVATITLRGTSIREPLQKACLPIEKQTQGGKSSLKQVSHAKSSSCQLGLHLNMPPLPAHSPTSAPRHTIPQAKGLWRTLSSSPSHDLHSSPI